MTTAKSCLVALCAAVASLCAITPVATAAAPTCAGDCNGNGSVAIDEIILGAPASPSELLPSPTAPRWTLTATVP
jgi:hypothetical protein